MSSVIVSAEVFVTSPGRNYVTLKVVTDDGIVGWGDATVNGRELAVAAYLRDHVCPLLVGRDADRIEETWQLLYRGAYWRRGPITMAAIGAVDLALWDIKGKALGVPAYQLLGGAVRDGILSYAHASGWELSQLLDAVDERIAEGYLAVRAQSGIPGRRDVYAVASPNPTQTAPGLPPVEVWDTNSYLRHIPDVLASVRTHVGPELHLLHDAHHRLTPIEAARLGKELEPTRLFWLEDVVPGENQESLRLVRQHTTTPLAMGEVFNSIWDCRDLIASQSIDFIRTNVMHAGGISASRRINDFAALHHVKVAPHGPSDISPITMAACLHLDLTTQNLGIQEYMGYPRAVGEVFRSTYTFAQGYLHPGDAPGLGVEFDEQAARRFPYVASALPVAERDDGTPIDW